MRFSGFNQNTVVVGPAAADVLVRGNTISQPNRNFDSIRIYNSRGARVENNTITTAFYGIALFNDVSVANYSGSVTGNTITGAASGVALFSVDNVTVSGNTILNSTNSGVRIGFQVPSIGSSHNLIQNNTITGSAGIGISVTPTGTLPFNNNRFLGNTITGNGGAGISLPAGGTSISNNVVTGNTIRGNGGAGVLISADAGNTTARNNAIYANADISANGGLGFDLVGSAGVTANDAGDTDGGPNLLQNYPVVTSVVGTTVNFLLDAQANANGYRIDFYNNPGGVDPSGHGEGQAWLGSCIVASPSATVPSSCAVPGVNALTLRTTATRCQSAGCASTATTSIGETSEFSGPTRGRIVIVKDAVPNDAQDFAFTTTGTGLSDFSLDDDADGTLSNSRTVLALEPGTYTVTEALATGWNLTGLTCVDPNNSSTVDLANREASIDLDGNETATCTFTNTRVPTVIRLQKALPNGRLIATDQFRLAITGTDAPAAVTTTGAGTAATGSVTHATPTPGASYTLSETLVGTTPLTSYVTTWACTNTRPGGQTPSGTGTSFSLTPAAGDDLTCTFTNTPVSQPNFGTCDGRMFLSQGPTNTVNTTLQRVDTGTNPFTYPALGIGSDVYNGMGYNPLDNYLYAIRHNGGVGTSLLRIGADGSTLNLGSVAGLPAGSWVNGTFSDTGVFYVMAGGGVDVMRAIDISSNTSSNINLSSSVSAADFAWYDGLIYAVQPNGQLRSINTSTGQVVNIGSPSGTNNYGAMYASSTGLFGNANNGTGFFQFDPVTGARTLVSSSPSAVVNDGANCPLAPISFAADLAVTKTNMPTAGASDLADDVYLPGETRTYTLVARNIGPFGAQNVTVSDPVPAGIAAATVSWTCGTTTGGAACGVPSGTGALLDTGLDLPVGASATYTITLTVPADFSGDLVNTVTVTPGASNTDPNPGNNVAADTDQRRPTLRLVKTWSGAAINDAVTISATGTPAPVGTPSLASVANTAGETDTGAAFGVTPGATYTLTEVFTSGNADQYARSLTCIGNTGAGAALAYTADALTGALTVGNTAGEIVCTFANQRRVADVSIVKSADANPVVAGGSMSFALVVTNNGPAAANNVVVADTWTTQPGLDCSAGPATCTASGTPGTQCPAPAGVTPAALQAGLTIPALPSGGVVTLGLTCQVTATGAP